MSTKYAKAPAGDYALDPATRSPRGTFSSWRIMLAYAAGLFSAFALRFVFFLSHPPPDLFTPFPPGSTEVHRYPPPSPSNVFPSLFPSDVGHAGPTPTGAEPALVATAPSLPIHSGAAHLLAPQTLANHSEQPFDVFQNWGNLSPWFSVPRSAFGVDSPPEAPEGCRVTGLHLLHRHGARYPTGGASYGGPANFSFRLAQSESWKARGQLNFLNDWIKPFNMPEQSKTNGRAIRLCLLHQVGDTARTYKLGEEILTPFGRQQLYDLGVSMRMKYGFLLHNFTESNTLPVFRTESQDRMLSSGLNFALGFFGHPLDGKYQQLITIEEHGFNNTLAPSKTCTNSHDHAKGDRGTPYVRQWAEIYLRDALVRLRAQITGVDLVIEDTYTMQQLCAYETVALGYSKFCELFTPAEWEGFDYSVDLHFWYSSAFGSPVARGLGIGYVQELVARLSHTPISAHNSSTNATLTDDPRTFPLGQSLYVDATHEVVVLNVLTALNLTSFAKDGPLPATHIPHNRAFRTAHLAPFATNVQFQLLSCNCEPSLSPGPPGPQNSGIWPNTPGTS